MRKAAEHLHDPELPPHERARNLEQRTQLLKRCSLEYLRALERDPQCLSAWYGLGLTQRSLGDHVASLRALDMIFKVRGDGSLDGGELPGAA